MMSFLLLLLMNLPALPSWSQVDLLGWTGDGSALAFRGSVYSLERPDGVLPCEMVFLVVTNAEGIPQRLYRLERRQPMDEVTWDDDRAEDVWKAAASEQDAKRWLADHPLAAPDKARRLNGRTELRHGRLRLAASLTFAGKGCRTSSLRVQAGSAARLVLRDECPEDSGIFTRFESSLQAAWSPDGKRAAIAWNIIRSAQKGAAQPSRSASHFSMFVETAAK